MGKLTTSAKPTTDELLDEMNRHARLPLSEMRKYPSGIAFAHYGTGASAVWRTRRRERKPLSIKSWVGGSWQKDCPWNGV